MSAELRSFVRAMRTSLALIPLTVTGATCSIGTSSAQAEVVFTPITLPAISGKAVEGEVLQMTHGTWSTPPASYVDQWQRCNGSGNDCASIEHANGQTYRLTAADVGFTIRVGESAKNANGAVTPAVSEPTAVVQARATGNGGERGGGGGGGGSPPGSCCGTRAHVSPAKIKTLLARQLTPSGKMDSISALLRHRGLNMSFTLPEAGTLVVRWYFVPPGAKLARKMNDKPILAAAGEATFTSAGTVRVKVRLTAHGRKLLRHATKIRLEAKGTFAAKGEMAVSAVKRFALKR
jgi:hypothetical protein